MIPSILFCWVPARATARRTGWAWSIGLVAGLVALTAILSPAAALAHLPPGASVPPEPTIASLALDWSFDPLIWLPVVGLAIAWRSMVGRVNAAHPETPVARRRTVAWTAGLAAILVALDSGIEHYDTTLFSIHMVQHLLLTLVAPPLLLYAGPITLALRVAAPETRRRWILPFLHARLIRVLSFPLVAWLLFAGVMWATHFSPLFDAALEDELLHRLEHALYLTSALLFWWPVVGPDPSPWRMSYPARVLYTGLQMPQNTFLALAIYASSTPLYPHYASLVRSWGPSPLEDQQIAGGVMWLGGDLLFLGAILLLLAAWLRDEERKAVGEDRRLAPARAALREREARLAARLATEGARATEDQDPTSGDGGDASPGPRRPGG